MRDTSPASRASRLRAVNVRLDGAGVHRWHVLLLELPDDAAPEEVLGAVADEFARREADFYARQGRLPL